MSIDELEFGDAQNNTERSLLEGLKFYFNVVWSRRVLIISCTIIGAVFSLVFSFATLLLPADRNPLPNKYRAYTEVLIKEGNSSSNDSMAFMMDMMGFSGSSNQGMTSGSLAQMVYSSFPYADSVIDKFNLIDYYKIGYDIKSNSRRRFYSNSSFGFDSRTNKLIIAYTDTDKYLATDIVKFMLVELERWFREQGGVTSESQLANIESKLYDVSSEINILEEKIKGIQLEYGVLSIDDLAAAQQSLVSSLNEQLMNLDLQISQQENAQTSFSPLEQGAVKELKAQREDVANTLYRLETGLPVGNKVYPPAEELPNISLEFKQLQLLYEIQSGIYLSLTKQYETLKLSSGGGLSFTVLEPAEVPEAKDSPHRSQICIQITAFSFFVGIAITFILFFINRIKLISNSK